VAAFKFAIQHRMCFASAKCHFDIGPWLALKGRVAQRLGFERGAVAASLCRGAAWMFLSHESTATQRRGYNKTQTVDAAALKEDLEQFDPFPLSGVGIKHHVLTGGPIFGRSLWIKHL